jgi:hypothetical protein
MYDLYVDAGYWDDGYTVDIARQDPPSWSLNPTAEILKSYLYQQYQPDENVESFFAAYNITAQQYFDYVQNLNLPIWISDTISGDLLDFVALYLYGFNRPALSISSAILGTGIYNTAEYNTIVYNEAELLSGQVSALVNDDIFKRCLTWNLYKADGFQFTAKWLKNRVFRFLSGVNGVPVQIYDTYGISVTFLSNNDIVIAPDASQFDAASLLILQKAIEAQILQLPFQYSFSVTL